MIKNVWIAWLLVVGCDRPEVPPGYQGVVELDERVLSFEVPGRVTTVAAHEGQQVTPRDVLATLDDAQAQIALSVRAAEARAAEEHAALVGAGSRVENVRVIEARLRAARSSEQLASKRYQQDLALVAKGVLAQVVADDTEARLRAATAEREALEQQLRELRGGARKQEVASAEAQAVAAAAAARLEADRGARYHLRALDAGEVLDVHVEPGEVVGAGTPVVTVGDTAHPYIDVFVPLDQLAGVRVGAAAALRVDATAATFRGRVERVSRRTEFTPRYLFSEGERANLVVRARIRVDDPERQLHAGTPGFVTLVAPASTPGAPATTSGAGG